MKERPIRMRGDFAQACHDGTKTQMRMPVTVQPPDGCDRLARVMSSTDRQQRDKLHWVKVDASGVGIVASDDRYFDCPYGVVGDRLWVQETWQTGKSLDNMSPKKIEAACLEAGYERCWAPLEYPAAPTETARFRMADFGGLSAKHRPSTQMPRWACRTVLEVTGVSVERLQDITDADAVAEGVKRADGRPYVVDKTDLTRGTWPGGAVGDFHALWDATYGKGAWDANPWVWVLVFTPVEHRRRR